MRLLPVPTVRHLTLGDRAALFCERAQQLFELNPTADLIWRSLSAGRTPAEAAEDLRRYGAPADQAFAFVTASAAEWIAAGRLIPAAIVERLEASGKTFDLNIAGLSCALQLNLEPEDPLLHQVATAFGQFAAESEAAAPRLQVVSQGGAYLLLADGAPLGLFPPERILPEIKAVLTDRLAKSVTGGDFLIHAAHLAQGGRGLLITGAPGAGKTTLTLALAARGLAYGSDDVVRVSSAGRLDGVPFSPASKSGAWDLAAPYLPGLKDLPVHVRGDGQRVRYAPTAPFAVADADRLGWVILLARRPAAAAVLEPVEPLAALTDLLGSAFAGDGRLQGAALQAFAAQIAAADCRRLVYSDLADGIAAIEGLVRG